MRGSVTGLMIFLILLAGTTQGQERCGTARDYVVQARERARADASRSELDGINQLLKRASNMCPGMGDVYYYRSLYERQLGNKRIADLMLGKATDFGSEALIQNSDPFAIPVTAAQAGIPLSATVNEKWALIVGISRFRQGIAPLAFPAKDARDFAALLQDSRYGRFKPANVRLLTDSEATTSRIKEGLNWLARSAKKDDLVVVFISSHGSPRESDTGGVSYVVTGDTDASNPDSLYATALPMIEIVEALSNRVRAQRGVLFLDTCFSGVATSGISTNVAQFPQATQDNLDRQGSTDRGGKALVMEGAGVPNSTIDRLRYSVGRVVITASQPDERSWESEILRNGYFTYYLIEGLKQNGGKLSVEQLYEYLKEQVYRRVMAEKNFPQRPMMRPVKPNVDISIGVDTHPL